MTALTVPELVRRLAYRRDRLAAAHHAYDRKPSPEGFARIQRRQAQVTADVRRLNHHQTGS